MDRGWGKANRINSGLHTSQLEAGTELNSTLKKQDKSGTVACSILRSSFTPVWRSMGAGFVGDGVVGGGALIELDPEK